MLQRNSLISLFLSCGTYQGQLVVISTHLCLNLCVNLYTCQVTVKFDNTLKLRIMSSEARLNIFEILKKNHRSTFILSITVKGFSLRLQSFLCVTVKFSAFLSGKCKNQIPCFPCIVATLNVDRLKYRRKHTNGVFPLTESNSDSDILSYPIIIETIKICRNWYTGPNSDICSDFYGIAPIFSDRKEYLYLNLNRAPQCERTLNINFNRDNITLLQLVILYRCR